MQRGGNVHGRKIQGKIKQSDGKSKHGESKRNGKQSDGSINGICHSEEEQQHVGAHDDTTRHDNTWKEIQREGQSNGTKCKWTEKQMTRK